MAEPRDDRVSRAYRALPDEGPPPALDAAIQAAARRATGSRPGGARRWQVPLSIAAVLALAVGLSLHVDREKPLVEDGTPASAGSAEYPVVQAPATTQVSPATPASAPASPSAPAPSPPLAAPRASSSAPSPASPVSLPAPAPAPSAASAPVPERAPLSVPAPALSEPKPAIAAGASATSEAARAVALPQRTKSEASQDRRVAERAAASADESPEKKLETIASLRQRGLHEEADRALAAFRRDYPGYRLSEEWLRKVDRP